MRYKVEHSTSEGKYMASGEAAYLDHDLSKARSEAARLTAKYAQKYRDGSMVYRVVDEQGNDVTTEGVTLIPTVSTASPTQTGGLEDMFQVTVFNHATGAVTNASFKTLEDAKANLEQQVASFRSAVNGTNRVFFTASILDTRTGKYYGSVSDAPPAVTLTGASA